MPSRPASTTTSNRTRKRPEERRAEIVDAAAAIALDEGMERITLRAVAERLGVRPGLITHYFPAAEDLVVEAFTRASATERELFFPTGDRTPVGRLAHFVDHMERGLSAPLARLWLNAQHLSRFVPALDTALQQQDALDRERLRSIIVDGVASGDFGRPAGAGIAANRRGTEQTQLDVETAARRILLAVDGTGSYINSSAEVDPVQRGFVADVAEWTLGLAPGTLRATAAASADSAAPSA
ncbi:TetR/AcrR family transcriptional regulator [Schumannella sp. 10F1B-5-1]|uniref:TetR/AcrR family transcriptional regulator n=1 Tax=Schumannella sp. 10F1B-5-1 TaxID=2590780 RepID=UPI0011318BBD|nr:TetR/AcrR family transcriptional regulator [Schumannella sp. 10F1B-5-1]TPW71563.1 TetR/AcrR family transcriptional regulator [Schumannella sp. 10F1B-5-1]